MKQETLEFYTIFNYDLYRNFHKILSPEHRAMWNKILLILKCVFAVSY
jgi:hypothetical protein